MKRKPIVLSLAAVLCSLTVLFAAGPRVEIDETIRPVAIPEDIEQYLQKTEQGMAELKPGTEKTVIWADSCHKEKTPVSVVYIHGFSATKQETAPLAELIAKDLSANLFYTRLTGHGSGGAALADATVNDWLNDAAEAVGIGRRIGDKIVIIGSSTGGTLATWTAARYGNDIQALVLLSPNFGLKNKTSEILLLPWAEFIAPVIAGREQHSEPVNSGHGKFWTIRYPTRALMPMMGLVDLIRKSDLAHVAVPVYVAYSPDDRIVDSRETEKTVLRFGSQSITICRITDTNDPSKHIIAGDILAPKNTEILARAITQFFLNPSVSGKAELNAQYY